MGSLRQDDADQERIRQEMPWTAVSRPDEMYRLQMEVVAAASYLKRASNDTDGEKPARAPSFDLTTPREDPLSLADSRRAWLQTLDPELMPPPPADQFRLPGFGTVTAVAAAVGVAAGIALALSNAVRLPDFSTLIGGEGANRNASFSSSVLADLTQMPKAQARGEPAGQLPASSPTVVASAQPSEVEAAKSPIAVFAPLLRSGPAKPDTVLPDTAQPNAAQPNAAQPEMAKPEMAKADMARPETTRPETTRLETARLETTKPEMARPESVKPPATEQTAVTPAAPPAHATPSLSRDETATLFQRGRDLLNAGDIASARLILQHLAESGNAEASYALARTFDGNVLKELGVIGAKPDPLKARAWYQRAAELGSVDARQYLQQSAQR